MCWHTARSGQQCTEQGNSDLSGMYRDRMKQDKKRLITQICAALLQNANVKGFTTGRIYQGDLKRICVPGLNCYSCPGAIGSCPLGSLQNGFGGSRKSVPFYVIGFLLLFGSLLGRVICGFLCPFGLIQDLLYRIPFFQKIRTFPGDRYLRWIKYVLALLLVVALPVIYSGVPYFCKYVCPAGMLFGAIPLLSLDQLLSDQIGPLFWWKMTVLIVIVLVSLLIPRPFCRYFCPLGGFYGLFNRVALIQIDKKETCISCNVCSSVCTMGIDPKKEYNSVECIRCGACIKRCPTEALCFRFANIDLTHRQANKKSSLRED